MPRPPDILNLVAWIAAFWLALAAIALVLVFTSPSVRLHWTSDVYLASTVLFSLIAFGAMGIDKRRAGTGKRRISELSLHTFELLGGWPGSMLGQRTFRHKTRKVTYQVVFWSIVGVHLVLIAWTVYLWRTLPATPAKSAEPATTTATTPDMVIEPKPK